MSKHLADIEIGKRAVEELYRLFPTLSEAAISKRIGLDRKCFWEWKCGTTPGGYALSVLCYAGCDIKYILTGRRGKNEHSNN
jgi:hypothetical protein